MFSLLPEKKTGAFGWLAGIGSLVSIAPIKSFDLAVSQVSSTDYTEQAFIEVGKFLSHAMSVEEAKIEAGSFCNETNLLPPPWQGNLVDDFVQGMSDGSTKASYPKS
jgi:hypothetical protein